jgi:LPS sulfotransferase NodH
VSAPRLRRGALRGVSELLRVVQPLERLLLRRSAANGPIAPPPVFLVGAPRSGSTLLFQVLVNCLDVAYTSNLAGLFYHSLYLGTRVHRWAYGDAPFNRFESRHGRTSGLAEPAECGKFWYRWFPTDRHFVGGADVDMARMTGLRETFAAIARSTGTPMFVKNLNCGQRLQVLRQVLPEALIVFVRRDPLETAASILDGRMQANGDKEAWWSVMPRNIASLRRLPYPEQVARQVYELEAQIRNDMAYFPPRQRTQVHYDDLCADPTGTVDRVREFLARNGARVRDRPGAALPEVQKSAGARISPEDLELLRAEVGKLPW